MSASHEYIDHEVRIRLLEEISRKIDDRFDIIVREMKEDKIQLLAKMDSNFHWVLGTILTQIALIITLFGGIILHMAKIIG
jgi:quinol-cytochrome oxidoreductase complex cytochrome b subunit